ncbi:MAG: hypothetical protein JXB88_21840, partial [Spirochaetales bacterium]|nr:hypothetical protein [Spirochaetales bacterium]
KKKTIDFLCINATIIAKMQTALHVMLLVTLQKDVHVVITITLPVFLILLYLYVENDSWRFSCQFVSTIKHVLYLINPWQGQ